MTSTTHASALFSPESEVALIGAAMYAPDRCADALDQLSPDAFGDPVHAAIWHAIRETVRAGGHPQPAIVRDRVGAHPGFEPWGGFDVLWSLWDKANLYGLGDHAKAIADRAQRRAVLAMIDEVRPRVTDTGAGECVAIIAELEQALGEIGLGSVTEDRWSAGGDVVRNALQYARTRDGAIPYSFGVAEVDEMTGGMTGGEVTLVGARPGVGKTVVGMTAARANASAGLGVCVFSLEMAENPLGLRLASDLAYERHAPAFSAAGYCANPTADAAVKNQLSPDQWRRMDEAAEIVSGWPLLIDTRPGLTLVQIESAARRAHRKWAKAGVRPGPIIIDHLGKVRPSVDRRGNRHAEVADASAGISDMAKRLGVPVLALVQLNRQVEGRGEDKRPILSDLRQAGELEEDARQVIFLHRAEYYLRAPREGETFDERVTREQKLRAVANKLDWIVEKNSSGPRGQVLTFVDIACSAIRSWEP